MHERGNPRLVLFNFQGLNSEKQITLYGGVAQLGEHLPCKQGVKGSIPFISTKDEREPMTTGNNGL